MIVDQIEIVILRQILLDNSFATKVLPYILPEYFSEKVERTIFSAIYDYSNKYNSVPTKEALLISLDSSNKYSESEYSDLKTYLKSITPPEEDVDTDWLLEQTEKWCQERAVYNAVLNSVSILNDQKKSNGGIPKLLQDALAVSFDPNIGHDYLEDHEERYQSYHEKVDKIPFDLKYFNRITKGGIERKTLNIILAGTGVGKSLAMCHFAASYLSQGYNVLYITLEMSEKKIAARIDANLLNIKMDQLMGELPKVMYDKKIANLKQKTTGKLLVREYPTATANCNHFRHLLDELDMKLGFKPDIIFVDYLNIATSCRVKSSDHSYTYVKSIAEEVRGLAVEYNVGVWSATQVNRSGFNDTDFGVENTSESFGIPATADFMCGLINTEELEELNQIVVKQLKNRYDDLGKCRRFVVGIDRPKMRLYDVDDKAQEDLHDYAPQKGQRKKKKKEDDTPAFDKGKSGQRMRAERNDGPGRKLDKAKFGHIK